ncbi:MAG: hypothetical protein WCC17_03575 [Candidatus Nitrosopolaris sp.]
MVLVQRIHHLLHLLQAVAGLKKASEKRNKDQTIREKHDQSGTANSGAGAIYYMAKNCTGETNIPVHIVGQKSPLTRSSYSSIFTDISGIRN